VSAGQPSTSSQSSIPSPTAPLSVPDECSSDSLPVPPTTPPSPHTFARPAKYSHPSYADPAGFPTPPSYPPVPGLIACGSSSTSTRSSAYTSPGASAPLSSNDLSTLGIGLGKYANREDDSPYTEDDAMDIGAAITADKPILPHATSYHRSLVRESSESSISRLQFAANNAAAAGANGNGAPRGWTEGYAPSTRSGSSSYEGSPIPVPGSDQRAPKKLARTKWRTVDEDDDPDPADDSDAQAPPPSSFHYRSRKGTVASSRSESMSGLTSASEDETDADEYGILREGNEEDTEEPRTAAIVVAEEGRGLIVHGEGQNVTAVNIQPGTTHLLLASLATPNSLPTLLSQTLPSISSTLLALDISANYLSALPPALATCMQLTELNIANNPLRVLPVWLAGLEGLRVLIADATGLTTLPPELVSLRSLNVLSIRRNKLMALPAWFARLPALERLEVEGNPFQGPWKTLLAPLIASRPILSVAISVSGDAMRQQQQQLSSISNSNMDSVYGPGLSIYGEPSLLPNPHDTTVTPNEFPRIPQLLPPYSAAQGSFFSMTDSDSSSMPNSAVESDGGVTRRFIPEEEEYTIVPRVPTSSSLPSLLTSSQSAISPSPLVSPLPTLLSPHSFTSHNSPTQLAYMSPPSARSNGYDRFEKALVEVHEGSLNPGPSLVQRAPTFSVVDRRTPSPFVRPLSRTRTTPSRSRLSSGSGSGSIATFIADQGQGEMGSRSRRSSSTSQRPRTASNTSQRPHTDYAPTRYGGPLSVEDSGFYGNNMDYLPYERKSDGSECFGVGSMNGTGVGIGSRIDPEEERRREIRRMRSADELRRALESVIGPSRPMAPTREQDGDTDINRTPPFFVSRLDPRPPINHHHTADSEMALLGSNGGIARGVTLTDRPPTKRFASLGPAQGLGGGASTRVRPTLMDGMWDADGDADVEGDEEERRKKSVSRPMSPTEQDRGPTEDPIRSPKTKAKWGFLKKMSMGRMRPEVASRPLNSQSSGRSIQTSSQDAVVQRMGPSSDHVPSESSPTTKLRKGSREPINSASSKPTPPLPVLSIPPPSLSSLSVPSPQLRSLKRRSFLSLDGPPALNIPIPSTVPFLPETMIATNGMEEEPKPTAESRAEQQPSPPLPPPLPPVQELEQQTSDMQALRSVMAYLRDMADLGMSSSTPGGPMGNGNLSTLNLGSGSSQDNEDGRSRHPTLVDSNRVLSDGSLASNASSGSGLGAIVSRSDDQRANTMSMITTDSGGSGKGDEERSKHKDDKYKRALIIKEIVETERTYVNGLRELIDIYVKPASLPVNTLGNAVASTKETVIPQQERKIVFNGLDSLFSFHSQSFLPALEGAVQPLLRAPTAETDVTGEISMTAATSIANVFVSHAAFMRMYSTYINNFDNAVQRLKQWTVDRRPAQSAPSSSLTSPNSSTAHLAGMALQMSAVSVSSMADVSTSGIPPLTTNQRKRIKSYLKRCRLHPKHSQLNLESYLLLPVQRIPRYRMLLEELVRFTPPNPDALDDPMDRALTEISSLANNMNEGKREAESRRKLVQWQTRIRGKFPSPLVQPHRRLIMDGALFLTRVVRKSSVAFDVINPSGDKTNVQVECLAPEETPRSLVGILCNDLLVLCKDASAGKDHTLPVDLWAVLRMQTLPQPASIEQGNSLRVVDNKAILYFDAPSTSDALTWCRAINMHIPSSKT